MPVTQRGPSTTPRSAVGKAVPRGLWWGHVRPSLSSHICPPGSGRVWNSTGAEFSAWGLGLSQQVPPRDPAQARSHLGGTHAATGPTGLSSLLSALSAKGIVTGKHFHLPRGPPAPPAPDDRCPQIWVVLPVLHSPALGSEGLQEAWQQWRRSGSSATHPGSQGLHPRPSRSVLAGSPGSVCSLCDPRAPSTTLEQRSFGEEQG